MACLRDCARSAAEARSPTCCTPDYGLLIELDGRIGHTGDGRFRDMRRDNAAATDGLAALRYGWHDVSGAACSAARQVAGTLELYSWLGPFIPCPSYRRTLR